MNLIDTHCHLSELTDQELHDQCLAAASAGLSHLIAVGSGYGLAGIQKTLQFTTLPTTVTAALKILCVLGEHPHEAKSMTKDMFEQIAHTVQTNASVVGVGEVGLDFHYNFSPIDQQKDVLTAFVDLARTSQKPLAIHDRECGDACVQIIKQVGGGQVCGVAHCFSGSAELAKQYLDLGFYLSFSGIITFKKSDQLRNIVKSTPLNRILIETDSPYLAPVPFRGKPNQPAYVRLVAEQLAQIHNISCDELAGAVLQDAKNLFAI